MIHNAVGIFNEPASALAAAAKLKQTGFSMPELLSPFPIEGVESVLGKKKSAIKYFTFVGATIGAISGFLLAAGTAVLYLHPTGGRPIITFPPFFIISYEMTILFGILATVLGFLVSARLPALRERLYIPEAAVDKFVVAVKCENHANFQRAEDIMHNSGATEVRHLLLEDL
jgi:Alternative complex III, ActD subunit